MVKLLILADDFTGALDTGVQFAGKGIRTQVIVGRDFKELDHDCEVMVLDVETRHVPKEEAYEIVYKVSKQAVQKGIRMFYKKTDSALRGNVGSELQAVADALPSKDIAFVPAFPGMHRITVDGIHYIDGIPVKESVFGQDPFEPVLYDRVDELLVATGYKKTIVNVGKQSPKREENDGQTLYVYDAETDEELHRIAAEIARPAAKEQDIPILAGCAGLATELPTLLQLKTEAAREFELKENLIFLCGSVNPITKSQLNYGEKLGIPRIYLTPEEKLEMAYWDQPEGLKKIKTLVQSGMTNILIDSNDEKDRNDTMRYAREKGYSIEDVRVRISKTLGYLLKKMMDAGADGTYLITGGDTLIGFMDAIGINELEPITEILPGCVLTALDYQNKTRYIITKSGGFGQERLIGQLTQYLKKQEDK